MKAGDLKAGKLRILVLHQHYWPEIAATAQILSDLCEDLAGSGHQVVVICGQPSYHDESRSLRRPSFEVHRGVEIRRVWSYAPAERTIAKRLLHYGSYFVSSLACSLLGERYDVCLVMSTPPLLLGVSGMLLSVLRRTPFVYSVQDLYPDIAIHLGVIRRGSFVAKASERVAAACYKSAAAIATLSDGMAQRLSAKGVSSDRLHVIPNWADTSNIEPTERNNAFACRHRLDRRFVVQYAGNMGLSQGLDIVLETAKRLENDPIHFVLIGDGNAKAGLQKQAVELRLPNVSFLPPQPRDNLSQVLGACDVGLVLMKSEVGNDLVPSKLYGIMAAARPVLAAVNSQSEVAKVLLASGCGWVTQPQCPAELAAAILQALRLPPQELARMGSLGREACVGQYSRNVVTQEYGELLRRTVGVHLAPPNRPRKEVTALEL